MEMRKSYIGKIDKSFGLLLMGRSLLEEIIPGSDSEKGIELACILVAQLIKSVLDELQPTDHSYMSSSDSNKLINNAINCQDQDCSLSGAPIIDVDARVETRLRELMNVSSDSSPMDFMPQPG